MRNSARIPCAAIIALILASCGSSDTDRESQMEAAAKRYGIDADVKLDEKGEVATVAVNGPAGGQVGKNLDLPTDFPRDVFVDTSWNLTGVNTVPTGGHMAQAMADSDPDALAAAVRKAMPAQGWTETGSDQSAGIMTRIGFEKDGRMTNYVIMAAGPRPTVQIITMKKPG